MRKKKRGDKRIHVVADNTAIGSIIIDLELDHSDYYTLVGSASLVHCFDLTVDFCGHHATGHFVFHRDRLVVGCFVQHWHRPDAAETEIFSFFKVHVVDFNSPFAAKCSSVAAMSLRFFSPVPSSDCCSVYAPHSI